MRSILYVRLHLKVVHLHCVRLCVHITGPFLAIMLRNEGHCHLKGLTALP